MDSKSQCGQALVELIISLFLLLSFIFMASQMVEEAKKEMRSHQYRGLQ